MPTTAGKLGLAGLSGLAGLFGGQGSQNTSGVSGTNATTNVSGQSSSSGNTSSNTSNIMDWLTNLFNQQQTTQQQQQQQQTTPTLSPYATQLMQQLTNSYGKLINQPVNLNGYASQQVNQINNTSDLQRQAIENIMASRGLSNSPVTGSAVANLEASRMAQINNMYAGLPVLQNQLQLGNNAAAGNFFQSIPYGVGTAATGTGATGTTGTQTQSGTQNQNQTAQNWSNQWNNIFQNTQNQSQTQQNQNVGQNSGGGIGGLLTGLATSLISLFSDQRLKKDIKPADKAVEKIMKLKPVTWKWKGGEYQDAGFLAQDVEQVLPELVHTDPKVGFKKVNYAGIIPFLVSAVQDLNQRVEG